LKEIIKIEKLNKTFHTEDGDFVALRDIDLSVREGEIFGIIGLSGAGKSTLVRCMNFLERPTEGTVTVAGEDLAQMSKRQLLKARQSIGMIFQGFNLLSQRNALKNVCYPMEIAGYSHAKAEKRARELLEIVGLSDKAKSYPSQLSGGQKQRVAIARALATEPKILLCDEATSALDPTTTRSILDLLQRINREMGVTIVIITHEMKVIEQICHRVAVIDQSRIVEMGDVHDVFVRPQSAIAKELVLPKGEAVHDDFGKRRIRIVFDGMSSFEPVIADMVLSCRAMINIMYANTKDIDGKVIGQMVVQLPEGEGACERIVAYLTDHNINFSEEDAK
jgi:D-methionine transport system ATP-binding protein